MDSSRMPVRTRRSNQCMRTVDLDELRQEGSKRAAKGRRKKAWGTINRWSAKHNWIARAAAWDREVDGFVRARQREEIARMRVETRRSPRRMPAPAPGSPRRRSDE